MADLAGQAVAAVNDSLAGLNASLHTRPLDPYEVYEQRMEAIRCSQRCENQHTGCCSRHFDVMHDHDAAAAQGAQGPAP